MAPAMARRLGYENPADIVGQEIIIKTITLNFSQMQRLGSALTFGLTSMPLDTHHQPIRVAGLIGEEDQPLSGFLRVLLPLERAKTMRKITFFSTLDLLLNTSAPGGYAAARVQLEDDAALEPVRQAIEQQGVYVSAARDQFKQLERLFVIMDLALGIIGFIALLVATIGIANTMMMSVMERTREIGVMKAVGGEEGDLQRLFLVESAMLGLIGGVTGLLFGWGIVLLIQVGVDYYLHRLAIPLVDVFHLPVWMIGAILGVALLVSLLAGLAPARRAARIEPIDALRSA
jgi:putative ABC transport system permease protein